MGVIWLTIMIMMITQLSYAFMQYILIQKDLHLYVMECVV
jgi:hypothetical protein